MSNFVDKDSQTKSPSPTRTQSSVPTSSPSVPLAVRQLQDFNNTGQTETDLPRASKRVRRRPDNLTFNAQTDDGNFPSNEETGRYISPAYRTPPIKPGEETGIKNMLDIPAVANFLHSIGYIVATSD